MGTSDPLRQDDEGISTSIEESRAVDDKVGELNQRLMLLNSQIADLQKHQQRPWWRDAVFVLSILTFVFSVAITAINLSQVNTQYQNQLRAEFRAVAARLAEIRTKDFEVRNSSDLTDIVKDRFSSETQIERGMLVYQLNSILQNIQSPIEYSDYYLIAREAESAREWELASEMYLNALKKAPLPEDFAIAARSYADMKFALRQFDEGRKQYDQAVKKLVGGSAEDELLISEIEYTEYLWAENEFIYGHCAEGLAHYDQIEKWKQEIAARKLEYHRLTNSTFDNLTNAKDKCKP